MPLSNFSLVELRTEFLLGKRRLTILTDESVSLAAINMIIQCFTILIFRSSWSDFEWERSNHATHEWQSVWELSWLPEINTSIIILSD
jgi:hypothetical protein